MGGTISQAANGLGNAIVNALSVPFKSIIGGTCEDVCTGPLDVICFIEHICVVNLLKLFIIYFPIIHHFVVPLPVVQTGSVSMCRTESLQMLLDHLRNVLVHARARLVFNVAHKLINAKHVYRGHQRRQLNHAREAQGECIVKDESDYSKTHLGSDMKRKFTEDSREGNGIVHRQKSNQHHRHRSHRHQSDTDMGSKQMTMGLRRWRSSRDHHERHHHLDTGREVDRRLSLKVER